MADSKDLLFELGSEELPASFILPALNDLENALVAGLAELRLGYQGIKRYGTPRRLALWVTGLAEKQDDNVREVVGPPVSASFDAAGAPRPAAVKFAEGLGLPLEKLERKTTPKGEYLCAHVDEKGQSAHAVLPPLLDQSIKAIQFKKSMRWGSEDVTYARPLHWIVALFGEEVLAVQYGSVRSGRTTRGHRFLDPEPINLRGPADYPTAMERGHVWAEVDRRRHYVQQAAEGAAHQVGGKILEDPGLLDIVTNLVEWPSAVHGSFDPRHLALPAEVLVSEMKSHQKYFSVVDVAGKLMPHFVAISNTPVKDLALSRSGYERVLRARLADARFFFDEDQKRKLSDRVDDLKKVVFQQQLGTSYEKMTRFRSLAVDLAAWTLRGDKATVERAATLSKADLVTGMVGEFPELQGIMGREYARAQGETDDVARAIDEHYLPRSSTDRIPETDAGALIGVADRLDSICGLMGIGKKPTGANDPFGIRRAALAVIHIVLQRKLRFSLDRAVTRSLELLSEKVSDQKKARAEVLEFFRDRLKPEWTQTHRADVVEAVLSAGFADLVSVEGRVEALSAIVGANDFEPLAVAFKRVVNIAQKQAAAVPEGEVDAQLFSDDAERQLYKHFLGVRAQVDEAVAADEWPKALAAITTLRPPVDLFFDKVLVMAEDSRVRDNRVRLLREIGKLFNRVADFSQIQTRG